jgi:hypothetical protein
MSDPVSFLVTLLSIAVFCLPPSCLALMLWRRRGRLEAEYGRAFRYALAGAGATAIVNLGVTLFSAPGNGLGTLQVIALGLSWACLCACGGLALLVRPRRRSAA